MFTFEDLIETRDDRDADVLIVLFKRQETQKIFF